MIKSLLQRKNYAIIRLVISSHVYVGYRSVQCALHSTDI